MQSRIQRTIFTAIENLNEERETPLPLEPSTPLLGPDSGVDSLSLVSLIVDIEQSLEEELGFSIVLADERAMSLKRSPFRTVGSLVEYVTSLVGMER